MNNQLINAINTCDLKTAQACLETGADANYKIEIDGVSPDDINQPDTPLRLLVFRLSDCMLEDSELIQLAEIAKLLLRYGADPAPAMQMAESRYGKFDADCSDQSPVMEIWRIIACA